MNVFKPLLSTMLAASFFVATSCSQTKKADQQRPIELGIKLADSDMARFPDASMLDWSSKPKWSYTQGLVSLALQRLTDETGDQKYYDYGFAYADKMIGEDGSIKTYKKEKYNLDLVNSGKILFQIYAKTGEQRFKTAMDTLYAQLESQPTTSDGGYWHKKIYPYQMWLDGVYMADPFHAQYGKVFNKPEAIDHAMHQVFTIQKHTHDSITGLNFHGWDESREQAWADSVTGLSQHVWGRAQGWYAMALVDILDFVPEDHPQRAEFIGILKSVYAAILKAQDPTTGVWWQVMDAPGREGNYLESTCSSMFVYAFAKANRMGYVDDSYMEAAKKGFDGIVRNFIKTEEDGSLSLTQCCAVAGLGGNPYRDGSFEYYTSTEIRDNDPKGVGPFVMATIELQKDLDQHTK
ncbi:unsaturated rhamnogalacturonyl hydrolase [Mangrovibacterium marinum]|uniref:Unsaturated rhamnogalacturonyl hydrolase n=1 Tax=Mangrovibacterium marinum TaxID=1639118 RepID=A0A2T5C594_9BACT|nr:glycoside hydrolase family 88 protein [Mangrovibacterium marinum]PTN10065.1 unsaturated rhamnogalacturonyl hydrolase [Mangrovibacterium marinum]